MAVVLDVPLAAEGATPVKLEVPWAFRRVGVASGPEVRAEVEVRGNLIAEGKGEPRRYPFARAESLLVPGAPLGREED